MLFFLALGVTSLFIVSVYGIVLGKERNFELMSAGYGMSSMSLLVTIMIMRVPS